MVGPPSPRQNRAHVPLENRHRLKAVGYAVSIGFRCSAAARLRRADGHGQLPSFSTAAPADPANAPSTCLTPRMHSRLLQTGRECVREISHRGWRKVQIGFATQYLQFSSSCASYKQDILASAWQYSPPRRGVDGRWVALQTWGSRSTTSQGSVADLIWLSLAPVRGVAALAINRKFYM